MTVTTLMVCSVCEQIIGNTGSAEIDAAFYGAVAYAICPSCGRVVEDHEDSEYRIRADEFATEAFDSE